MISNARLVPSFLPAEMQADQISRSGILSGVTKWVRSMAMKTELVVLVLAMMASVYVLDPGILS